MQEEDQSGFDGDDSDSTFSGLRVQNAMLTYIGKDVTSIPEVFPKLHGKTIEHLDLSFNSIIKLNGLEGFPKLKELILDNNCISDGVSFPYMSTLKTLSMNNNDITDLVSFIKKVKYSFPNLVFLSLLGNTACPNQLSDQSKDEDDYQRYRFYVLHHLRKLKFLDSAAVTASELRDAKMKGQYMQVKKPKIVDVPEPASSSLSPNFTPLPSGTRPIGDHRGAFTVFKYRYTNKESEGNRFIVNADL